MPSALSPGHSKCSTTLGDIPIVSRSPNNRLLDIEEGQVRFKWKDYRHGDQMKTMMLEADEFIRRFLMHVLPAGFHRIRYYGFLGNRHRRERLAECRGLLGMSATEFPADLHASERDYRHRYEDLTGRSLRRCPHCGQGKMIVVALLPRSFVGSVIETDSS